MFDFYFYSNQRIILLFLFSVAMFIMQSVYIGMRVSNDTAKKKWLPLGELGLLFYIAGITLLPIVAMFNRAHGMVDVSFLSVFMYTIGIAAGIYYVVMAIVKGPKHIVPALCIALSLPYMSVLPFGGYLVCYISVVLVLTLRAFEMLRREIYLQKHQLSPFSLKEGLDTLPAGIMFCDTDGYIYLINTKMKELILRFFEKDQKNSIEFWQNLKNGLVIEGDCQFVEGDILLRTTTDAWRFSRQSLNQNDLHYIEIIAIDVSETIGALNELEEEREKLIKQNAEIRNLSQKMERLRKEQEYSRIRSQVHDVMGQRLTAMQRILQSHNTADYSNLLPLLQDMISQIKAKESGSAQQVFVELHDYFQRVGLSIDLVGKLPSDESAAFLVLAVLREACTNAARHAGATAVCAHIEQTDTNYRIEITNNGTAPKCGISEGGGLSGIRSRVENYGGTLKVELIPEFALIITIERGQWHDKGFDCG